MYLADGSSGLGYPYLMNPGIWAFLDKVWPYAIPLFLGVLALVASGHAVLHKRDSRSVIGWVGLIWLAPLVGTLLYVLLGINRIRRRAQVLRGIRSRKPQEKDPRFDSSEMLGRILPAEARHLAAFAKLGDALTGVPVAGGNRVEPLCHGGQAYPAMLEAIDAAQSSLAFSTYIFSGGPTGQRFIEAFARAVRRKVEVRILIDDIGARYSWPSAVSALRQAQVPVARFLPALLHVKFPYFNLRNHRKILVADGKVGFTGGMNIQDMDLHDLHCRIEGPAVRHLQETFAEDWRFATSESLEGKAWFPEIQPRGDAAVRGIVDGPDDDTDTLRILTLGALASARHSVRIATPYFLPDDALINALNIAVMRGVTVDILLPAKNNLRMVQWASTAILWQVLKRGCRIRLSPPPFDHGKLLVVDHAWTLLGSSNWDPRSFRLNFEFDVECYDPELARTLEAAFDAKLAAAKPLTLAEVDGRGLPVKIRDGVARLFTPYL